MDDPLKYNSAPKERFESLIVPACRRYSISPAENEGTPGLDTCNDRVSRMHSAGPICNGQRDQHYI